MSVLAVVAIGRNEGERLLGCLQSLADYLPEGTPIVYVDSGSTDGSCEMARERGVHVIDLDLSIPFTAARARNAGWQFLLEKYPDLQYIQFMDGDCLLVETWMDKAIQFLQSDEQYAVVCGRRRERFPEASDYNRLVDMEWDTPVGEADACGGDALIRVAALQAVKGYDGGLICGEEPEMCIRMRRKGWKIYRIDAEMTLHDADMHKLSQWWKRAVRTGWAVAEGFAFYGKEPEQYMKKENTSGWLWGAIIPGLALCFAAYSLLVSLLLLLAYGYLYYRIYQYRLAFGDPAEHSTLYARYCLLSKLPQAWGQLKYWRNRWSGKTATLIEYKGN